MSSKYTTFSEGIEEVLGKLDEVLEHLDKDLPSSRAGIIAKQHIETAVLWIKQWRDVKGH